MARALMDKDSGTNGSPPRKRIESAPQSGPQCVVQLDLAGRRKQNIALPGRQDTLARDFIQTWGDAFGAAKSRYQRGPVGLNNANMEQFDLLRRRF